MARNRRRSNERSRPAARDVVRESMRNRKRYTPQDIEGSWDKRSAQAKAGAQSIGGKLTSPQGVRACACVLLLGLTVTFVSIGSSAQSRAGDEIAGYEQEIQAAVGEQAVAQEAVDAVPDADSARQMLSSAKEKGNAVAAQQNAYLDTTPGDTDEVSQIASKLSGILGEAGSTSEGLDPKTPWFKTNADVEGAPQGSDEYSWSFESSYGFVGDEVVVTWLCREKSTGTLLAWTMATYESADDTFVGFSSGVTSTGGKYIGATPSEGSENPEPVDPDAPTIGPDDEIGTDGEGL